MNDNQDIIDLDVYLVQNKCQILFDSVRDLNIKIVKNLDKVDSLKNQEKKTKFTQYLRNYTQFFIETFHKFEKDFQIPFALLCSELYRETNQTKTSNASSSPIKIIQNDPIQEKLKTTVDTHVQSTETKPVGIEVVNFNNNDQKTCSNQRISTKNDYCQQNIIQQLPLPPPANMPYCNTNNIVMKRKYDISSPNNMESTNNYKNVASPILSDNTIQTTENCYNSSNNSTPKKRRILIGKNIEKVPELSISTIERHLETLISNPENCLNEVNDQNEANNNSILIVENVNTNDDNLFDLDSSTISNVLQNIQNTPSIYLNTEEAQDAQMLFESFIKNPETMTTLATPHMNKQDNCSYTISNTTIQFSPIKGLNTVLKAINYNEQTKSMNETKKIDDTKQRASNSEIVISKIPTTSQPRPQPTHPNLNQPRLLKMQEALQLTLQNSLAIATNNNSSYIFNRQPKQSPPPNRQMNKTSQPQTSNTATQLFCALTDPQNMELSFDGASSTSTSSSPNGATSKKKRVYTRKSQTIRKIIETDTGDDELSHNINVMDMYKTTKMLNLDVKGRTDASNDLYAVCTPSTNDDNRSNNEDSRDSRF